MGSSHDDQAELRVQSEARRDRVTALVKEKWPTPLSPNRLLNAILDIIRGEAFAYEDVIEAIDALTWMHLPYSLAWGVAHRFPKANNEVLGVNDKGQNVYDPKDGHPPDTHYVDASGHFATLHHWEWMALVVETRKLARRDAVVFAKEHPNRRLDPEGVDKELAKWPSAPDHLRGYLDVLGEDPLHRNYLTHLIESVDGHIPYGHPARDEP